MAPLCHLYRPPLWPLYGTCSGTCNGLGTSMAPLWPLYGTCNVIGPSMALLCPLYGTCNGTSNGIGTSMAPLWHLYGTSMAPLWHLNGTSMAPLWHLQWCLYGPGLPWMVSQVLCTQQKMCFALT